MELVKPFPLRKFAAPAADIAVVSTAGQLVTLPEPGATYTFQNIGAKPIFILHDPEQFAESAVADFVAATAAAFRELLATEIPTGGAVVVPNCPAWMMAATMSTGTHTSTLRVSAGAVTPTVGLGVVRAVIEKGDDLWGDGVAIPTGTTMIHFITTQPAYVLAGETAPGADDRTAWYPANLTHPLPAKGATLLFVKNYTPGSNATVSWTAFVA